jgi:molecular chaperone Hsp33
MTAVLDHVQPFLLENLDIRGAIVALDGVWHSLLADRGYPVPVARLLGELSAVTALIGANLKQPGRMTFQLRGEGPVNLLVLDCDEQLRLRGMTRWNPELPLDQLGAPDLLGHGQLALTLDSAGMRQPYQSLVPLTGDSIAAIFEHYLSHSEQQPTRIILGTSESRAVGLYLQKLPGADAHDNDGWNRVQHLLATLGPEDLLGMAPVDLLRLTFPDEDIRVFDPRAVTHHCPEDWEKIHRMLLGLGREECDAILREAGEILIHDDLCNREYRLGAAGVAALFEPNSPTPH